MADGNNNLVVPGASGGVLGMGGFQGQVVDFDPERFPDGVDIMFQVPGQLELLGPPARLPKGALLLVIPPEVGEQMRSQIRTAAAAAVARAGKPN